MDHCGEGSHLDVAEAPLRSLFMKKFADKSRSCMRANGLHSVEPASVQAQKLCSHYEAEK